MSKQINEKFDPSVPAGLKERQRWFAGIISRPLDENDRISAKAPSGRKIANEAEDYIIPSPTLMPAERIEIYNQQFWWRLLNCLQEEFPLLTRLFGYKDFNEMIAVPYLQKYLPDHWSLSFLGNRLSRFLQEEYAGEDKKLICDAAALDWAYNVSFMAVNLPSLGKGEACTIGSLEPLMRKKVRLQPHFFLFEWGYDLFLFREQLMEFEPDFWLENDFPKLEKGRKYCFAFFRTQENRLAYEELDPVEFKLLMRFQGGSSIESVIDWLADEDLSVTDAASQNLHLWIQKWIGSEWLAVSSERCDCPYVH